VADLKIAAGQPATCARLRKLRSGCEENAAGQGFAPTQAPETTMDTFMQAAFDEARKGLE